VAKKTRGIDDGEAESGPETNELFVFAPPEGLTTAQADELMANTAGMNFPRKLSPSGTFSYHCFGNQCQS